MLLHIAYSFCEPTSAILAFIVRWILNTSHTLLLLISGLAYVLQDTTYVFLLFWTYFEGFIISKSLSKLWPESKPICSLTDSLSFRESRLEGMPSDELFFITMASSFLLLHQYLVRQTLPFAFEKFIIFLVPVCSVCLIATRNASIGQVVFAFTVGGALGLYAVVVFHFLYKHHFKNIRDLFYLDWIVPGGSIPQIVYEQDDWFGTSMKTDEPVLNRV